MKRILPLLLAISALGVSYAFSQDMTESPEATDESLTNASFDAATATDESVAADTAEVAEVPAIEAADQTNQVWDIPENEVKTAPAVEADPTPDTEIGDAPDLP